MTSIAELFAGEPQLVVTAVRGYRSWGLDHGTGALTSTGVDHVWGVPRNTALTAGYMTPRSFNPGWADLAVAAVGRAGGRRRPADGRCCAHGSTPCTREGR